MSYAEQVLTSSYSLARVDRLPRRAAAQAASGTGTGLFAAAKVEPESAVGIGDTVDDCEAYLAAGIRGLGRWLERRHHSRGELA